MPEKFNGYKFNFRKGSLELTAYSQPDDWDFEARRANHCSYIILPNGSLLKHSYTQELIFTDGWEAAGQISNCEEVIIGRNARIEERDGENVLIYDADTTVNHGYNQ